LLKKFKTSPKFKPRRPDRIKILKLPDNKTPRRPIETGFPP